MFDSTFVTSDTHGAVDVDFTDDLGLSEAACAEMGAWCGDAALAAAAHLPLWKSSPLPWNVSIRVGGAEEGRRLNRDFRGKDYATNVLSFPTDEDDAMEEGAEDWHVGDIFVCLPVVEAEAREAGKSLEHHLRHMVIHGVLHLGGHDHMNDHDAEIMEKIETELLAGMGISDPYADSELVREDH